MNTGTASHKEFSKSSADSSELARVRIIANNLLAYIQREDICARITIANAPNKPSHGVQACIAEFMRDNGFQSEKKGVFSNYKTANLRPDFYLELSPGRGITLEVERGKTVHNNMDLLDMWKCHICTHAQHLFLLVPIFRVDQRGGKMKVFEKVVDRIAPFFQ